MTGSADVGREGVYSAELAAFDGTSLESLVSFEELTELAALITTAEWWPHGPIEVLSARRNALSSSTRTVPAGTPTIRLAAPQLTAATLVHEFAHVLAGVGAGHGPRFRRAHVDLVGAVLGAEAAGWLVDAYADSGLDLGERTWPLPASTSAGVFGRASAIDGDGFTIVSR